MSRNSAGRFSKTHVWLLSIAIAALMAFPAKAFSQALSQTAIEEDRANLQSEWSYDLPGDYHLPDLKRNLDDLVDYDRALCFFPVHQLVTLMDGYGRAASRSDGVATSHIRDSIADKFKANPQCKKALLRVYAVASVFLLDPSNYLDTYPDNEWLKTGKTNDFYRPSWAPGIHNLTLTFLTAALINDNVIHFFNQAKTVTGRPILGMYDCVNTLILADESLPPFDFGATLVHEMDHFFFDNWVTLDWASEHFPAKIFAEDLRARAGIDWRALVLEDETTSIFHQALLERRMTQYPQENGEPSYQVPGDLTLFDPQGISNDIWSGPLATYSGGDVNLIFSDLFSEMPISGTALSDAERQQIDDLFFKARERMLRLVQTPYFSGEPFSKYDARVLTGKDSIPLDPMFNLWAFPFDDRVMLASDPEASVDSTHAWFGSVHSPLASVSVKSGEPAWVNAALPGLVGGLIEVTNNARRMSPLCKAEQAAYALPHSGFTHYIGRSIRVTEEDEGGGGPKSSSTRRGGAGGVRGGAGGVRGGAGGVRGEVVVHPCLRMQD